MQNHLSFHLTAEDVAGARHYGFESELLYLLARRTGTLWNLQGPDSALEIMAPYRSARFLIEVEGVWQPYRGGELASASIRAEVGPSEALDSTLSDLEIPRDGIAHLAMRFFEARTDEASH